MDAEPTLSLIVPAHNAAPYIQHSLSTILATLDSLAEPFEVLLVCDGSTDGTHLAAGQLGDPRLRVLRYAENRGKGYAICYGVVQAKGRMIGWLDADLDIEPELICDAVRRLGVSEIDAVIGSKRHPLSEVHYPLTRRVLSACFQLLVRALFRVNVRDTQVGAKVFRREMLETVVPLLLIKRYAFDLEVLTVGAEFGFDRIEEMPVRLEYRFTGTGITTAAVRRMFIDTLAIAYRIHVRHWYTRQFAAVQRARGSGIALAPSQSTWSEIVSRRD